MAKLCAYFFSAQGLTEHAKSETQQLKEGVVEICGSGWAFAAIKADGSVVTWG